MTMLTLVLEALGPARPRWWGDFTPAVRGPIVHASVAPIPVPLPSTIAGALASSLIAANADKPHCSHDSNDPLACQRITLKRQGVTRIRGPILWLQDHYHSDGVPLIPLRDPRLIALDKSCTVYQVEKGSRIGIALSRTSKAVLEGLLYSEELAWAIVDSKGVAHPYRLAVEVEADPGILRKVAALHLGGERQLHQVTVVNEDLVRQALAKTWANAWQTRTNQLLVAIVTPVLLDPKTTKYVDILNPFKTFSEIVKQLLEEIGVKPLAIEPMTRCAIAGLAPGYDMALNLPRPYYPAILPGCIVRIEGSQLNPVTLYEEGLGLYTDLGWGTIAPLPLRFENCIKEA